MQMHETSSEVGAVADVPEVYKIPMVRMCKTLTNLRMYGL